jgi:hypothetical protein
MLQVFEHIGTLLTPTSGKIFVNAILCTTDGFFEVEVINLKEP